MTAPKTDLGIPYDNIIGTVDGKPVQISPVWQQHLGAIGNTVSKLRDAAELMDDLPASPTVEEISTAWAEVRTKLQEIV
jgi:hypothetical protein